MRRSKNHPETTKAIKSIINTEHAVGVTPKPFIMPYPLMSLAFNPGIPTLLMPAWLWRVKSRGTGSMPSGLLVNGLVALIIGLAALVGDMAFKSYMGFVGYVIIAALSAILIIMGVIRTARALRIRSATK